MSEMQPRTAEEWGKHLRDADEQFRRSKDPNTAWKVVRQHDNGDQVTVQRGLTRDDAFRKATSSYKLGPAPQGYEHGPWVHWTDVALPHTTEDDAIHAGGVTDLLQHRQFGR